MLGVQPYYLKFICVYFSQQCSNNASWDEVAYICIFSILLKKTINSLKIWHIKNRFI